MHFSDAEGPSFWPWHTTHACPLCACMRASQSSFLVLSKTTQGRMQIIFTIIRASLLHAHSPLTPHTHTTTTHPPHRQSQCPPQPTNHSQKPAHAQGRDAQANAPIYVPSKLGLTHTHTKYCHAYTALLLDPLLGNLHDARLPLPLPSSAQRQNEARYAWPCLPVSWHGHS